MLNLKHGIIKLVKKKEDKKMKEIVKRLITEESGQGMVEYALILALVSIAAILALTGLGTSVKDKFAEIVGTLGGTVPTAP